MPDLKSLGWLSGEWFYLLIVEEPTKTALRLGENISACGVGMPRADGPQASPVKLLTPTALKPKPPAAVRLIRFLSDTLARISRCLIETSEERACLRNGLACPALPPRLEATFRFAVIVELALKRRLPTFLGGPFGGMVPI